MICDIEEKLEMLRKICVNNPVINASDDRENDFAILGILVYEILAHLKKLAQYKKMI